MVLSELFHKAVRPNHGAVFGLLGLCVLASGCAEADAVPASAREGTTAAAAEAVSAAPSRLDAANFPPAGFAWVILGSDTVVAEVASTADERAEGLMYRDEVPDGTGMLFVFQDSQPRAFWMANTYVALDIAYMNPSYRVVDIIAMEPLITESYPSSAPAMFALEVRQGWFAEQGITVGTQAQIVFGIQGR
jgi:uncharacterized membrane protein (UPF0127 family)